MCEAGGIWEISVPFSQFGYEPETAGKRKSLIIVKGGSGGKCETLKNMSSVAEFHAPE